jgi:hypothetical protein
MKKIILLLFVIAAVIYGCAPKEQPPVVNPDFEELASLVGTWKMSFDSSSVEEVWKKENDTLFKGYSYEVNGTDTVITELIDLYLTGDEIFYVPTTYGQNDGNPVPFKLTSREGGTFNFTNPGHDFPTLISYLFVSKDHVVATVSGEISGETRSLDFDYHRQ